MSNVLYAVSSMLAEASELKSKARELENSASILLTETYSHELAEQINKKAEPYGIVHLEAGEFRVSAEVDKKVTWDQAELKKARETIVGWGENPDEYIGIEYKVSEAKFKAWPSSLKETFYPARTIKPGPMKITISKKDA